MIWFQYKWLLKTMLYHIIGVIGLATIMGGGLFITSLLDSVISIKICLSVTTLASLSFAVWWVYKTYKECGK